MAKITVIFEDYVILKDRVSLHIMGRHRAEFDSLVAELNHTNLHAIQWDGETGEYEFKDTPHNGPAVGSEVQKYDDFYERVDAEAKADIKADCLSQDVELAAREIRNEKLAETGWWANSDVTMTDDQASYRTALRDLPSTDNWSPAWDYDDETMTISVVGVTWPVKPE